MKTSEHTATHFTLQIPGNYPLVVGLAFPSANVGHKGTPLYGSFVLTQNPRLSSVAVLWDLTCVYIRPKKNAHPSSRLGTHVFRTLLCRLVSYVLLTRLVGQ